MHALIWLNGSQPSQELAKSVCETVDIIAVVDGASNHAKAYNIIPDIICGDFDSIDPATIKLWWPNSEVIPLPDQNFTDFEKTIKLLLERGVKRCSIIGALGGWFDHLLTNVALITEYRARAEITLLDDGQRGRALSEGQTLELNTNPMDTISLVTLLPEVTVSISGVHWELTKQKLTRAGNGQSNRATGHRVAITLHRGETLFVIHSSRDNIS